MTQRKKKENEQFIQSTHKHELLMNNLKGF